MNAPDGPQCPDPQTLIQFMQGLLEPPALNLCERHVVACESCHQTLRSLDLNDTLSQYVCCAMEQQPDDSASDTQAIDALVQRLLHPPSGSRQSRGSHAAAEIMADRAAEVLRCVEPAATGDDASLGSLGNYRLMRLIGAGGTGVVFQAKDVVLDRVVALKVLRPSLGEIARDRFVAEARLAASIEHENVVTIYQIGQQGRLAFIAMQWLPGETLEARLVRQSGPMDALAVRELVSRIACGLAAAHRKQLIHRDIKPANIWICEGSRQVKILDFGLARIADEESGLTQTGMLAGTPSFMSPEQTRGMELDARSDLFSLGSVTYLLLTGKLPFSAPTVLGTLQTIQSDAPQPPSSVHPLCDPDLSDLTMSLLEKLPGNRLSSAENLVHCLSRDRCDWPEPVRPASATLEHAETALADRPEALQMKRTPASGSGIRRWLASGCVLGLLVAVGWFLAPQIFRIVTDQGELTIETSDENIQVQVLQNGELVRILDTSNQSSFDIKSGEYTFDVVGQGDGRGNDFEISPKTVTMLRGSQRVVTVTATEPDTPGQKPEPGGSGMASGTATPGGDDGDKTHDIAETYKAEIAKLNVERAQLKRTLSPNHPAVKSLDIKIEAMQTQYGPLVYTGKPLYRGRSFAQWYRVAKYDREPKTVIDAIAACAHVCDEDQKDMFLSLFGSLVRQHGTAQNPQNPAKGVYFNGFLDAARQLKPLEVVNFIEGELKNGNERSLGFCSAMMTYLDFNGIQSKAYGLRGSPDWNITPLMQRICDREIELNLDVRSILQKLLLRDETQADLSVAKNVIHSLDMGERSWLYWHFMKKFDKGEFDDLIERDFLAADTPGETREALLRMLDYGDYYPWGDHYPGSAGMYGDGGIGGGGGGFPSPKPSQQHLRLANRLMIKAMRQLLDADKKELDFATLSSIHFDKDGREVRRLQNGEFSYLYQRDDDVMIKNVNPKRVQRASGRAATFRNLLSGLCAKQEVLSRRFDSEDTRVTAFAQSILDRKDALANFDKQEIEYLELTQDLRVLAGRAGDDASYSIRFMDRTGVSGFGGSGAGGIF